MTACSCDHPEVSATAPASCLRSLHPSTSKSLVCPARTSLRLVALVAFSALQPAAAFWSASNHSDHSRPCTPTVTANCTPGRFVPCGTIRNRTYAAHNWTLPGIALGNASNGTALRKGAPAPKHHKEPKQPQEPEAWADNVTTTTTSTTPHGILTVFPYWTESCTAGRLRPRDVVLVQFTSQHEWAIDTCLEILVRVGECWGLNPANAASYDCQGRCGKSCEPEGVCSNWSENCLRHDVCSYYYGSSGGVSDPHCGYAFDHASSDYSISCWSDWRCRLANFNTWHEVCTEPPQALPDILM